MFVLWGWKAGAEGRAAARRPVVGRASRAGDLTTAGSSTEPTKLPSRQPARVTVLTLSPPTLCGAQVVLAPFSSPDSAFILRTAAVSCWPPQIQWGLRYPDLNGAMGSI